MLVDFIIVLIKLALVLGVILNIIPLMVWAERKGSALIQDRPGPNRASILGMRFSGLFHPLADVVKFIGKETVMPTGARTFYYKLAPILVLIPAFTTFVVIPFGDEVQLFGRTIKLQVANLNVGMLYMFAVASLGVYGIILAGWASNNKFALMGSLRSSAQMISYEISLGLSLIGLVMIYGSTDLNVIVAGQTNFLWGVFRQPIGFVLFLVALFAETNRNPFDLPEGESEIVAGYHLEYSSTRFASFFMAEYANIIVGSALIATLFFGGWQVPFLASDGFHLPFDLTIYVPQVFVVLLRATALLVKMIFFCWLFIWVRWTLPRFRYDQLMLLGWQVMLPLALLNIFITGSLILFR